MSSVSESAAQGVVEDVIEPALEICDPHHHIMNHPGYEYSLADFQQDLSDGHRVTSSVLVEAGAFFRTTGPDHLRPVGEVEFARDLQRQTEGKPTAVAKAIVAYADLTRGDQLAELLDAHLAASGGTLRGVRQNATRDASPLLHSGYHEPGPELYERADFRAGAAELAKRGLSFDAWQFYHQLPAVAALARAVPDLRIVIDHCGGIVGVGPYAGRRDEIFAAWRRDIEELARLPNVWIKLGGLGMGISGFEALGARPGSAAIASAFKPYMELCIEAFGPARAMFESNFPVDRHLSSYRTLWNALKRVAAGASQDEKALLFHGSASRCYNLA
jgi:predicted TIM-barrel fold metal-dependent hydrolase